MRKKRIWFVFLFLFFITAIVIFNDNQTFAPSIALMDEHDIIDDLQVDVTKTMIEKIDWEPSPDFESEKYTMTGIQDKVGFINPGFTADHANKYMWHFWGDHLEGELTVIGVKEEKPQELVPVLTDEKGESFMWSRSEPGGANNGAGAHLPSNMRIKESGKWALLVFLGDRYIDHIVVEVE